MKQSSKASQTGVSETGFSKKVLEQVREGLRISIRETGRFVFGGLVGWGTVKKMQCLTCWLHSKLFIFFWNPRVLISKKLVSFGVADFDEMDSILKIGGEEKQWNHQASFSHVFHTILKMTKTNMHLKIPTGRKKAERMKGEQKERKKGGQSWHTLTPDRSPPGGTYWQHAI